MDIYDDPEMMTVSQTTQPLTIITASDVISVIGGARDDDGGIKAVKMWATYNYRPGQPSGLATVPVSESISNASVGESTSKSRNVAFNFDLKKELAGWSSMEIHIWIEAENFYGGKVQTGFSIKYPKHEDDTDYMAFCRRRRVPVPPNLHQLYPIPPEGTQLVTGWVYQGKLQTNLLFPGEDAYVWTYSDAMQRGACIALPRGNNGQPNGLAGIICQSARTGNACFWDSRKRNDNDNWGSQPLIIPELKDASNLTEQASGVCTDCHRGNNVFLISPDDPIWAKVISGPLVLTPGSTFTTVVEGSVDIQGGHPRYIPMTHPSDRPDWVNAYNTNPRAECVTCHENPVLGFGNFPPMPPACAMGSSKPEDCYK
jgi:hypothetical protein